MCGGCELGWGRGAEAHLQFCSKSKGKRLEGTRHLTRAPAPGLDHCGQRGSCCPGRTRWDSVLPTTHTCDLGQGPSCTLHSLAGTREAVINLCVQRETEARGCVQSGIL
jgi:hypothetical protein